MIIPKENEKDLAEIPDNVKEGMKIIPVSEVSEVLKIALADKKKPAKEKAKNNYKCFQHKARGSDSGFCYGADSVFGDSRIGGNGC